MISTSNKKTIALPASAISLTGSRLSIGIANLKAEYPKYDLAIHVDTSDHMYQVRLERKVIESWDDTILVDIAELDTQSYPKRMDKIIYVRLIPQGKPTVYAEAESRIEVAKKVVRGRVAGKKPTAKVSSPVAPDRPLKSLLRTEWRHTGELTHQLIYEDDGPILALNERLDTGGDWPLSPYF